MRIMRTKSIEQSIWDTEESEFQLRKALGPWDLTLFGIRVIIGWDLILEFTLGAATVAKGWSGYFGSVLELVGVRYTVRNDLHAHSYGCWPVAGAECAHVSTEAGLTSLCDDRACPHM
jgi:hypothetical protein